MAETIAGIQIPDSHLACQATDQLREYGTELLFAHSLRVYLFGAMRGRNRGLKVDHELLYIGAVFHDLGLTPKYALRTTVSKWTVRTQPESSCAPTELTSWRPGSCGTRSRCIRLLKYRGISVRRSRSSLAGSRPTCSEMGWTKSLWETGPRCLPPTHGSTSREGLFKPLQMALATSRPQRLEQ
jgi:hypothetical protein